MKWLCYKLPMPCWDSSKQPCALPARQRAVLSAATTTPWHCGRRSPLGGTVWPRRRRSRHAHRGSKKRGAWRRHGTGRRQRWSLLQGRAFFLARLRQTVPGCVKADRSSGIFRSRHFCHGALLYRMASQRPINAFTRRTQHRRLTPSVAIRGDPCWNRAKIVVRGANRQTGGGAVVRPNMDKGKFIDERGCPQGFRATRRYRLRAKGQIDKESR